MQPQTLHSLSPSDSGCGPQKMTEKEWTMEMEGKKAGPPSIKLGLGIGIGIGIGDADSVAKTPVNVMTEQRKRVDDAVVVFTGTQLNELQQQTLVFKYIAARLPVPLHLVIPIWNSVASSIGTANGSIYKQYPSFVGFNPEGFDCRNMIESEPGRCRRTDGKKWRCSKNVVPDQKYCERHMHRGRQRSRKLVEASRIALPSDSTPLNNSSKCSENSETILNSVSSQLVNHSRMSATAATTATVDGSRTSATTLTTPITAANTAVFNPTRYTIGTNKTTAIVSNTFTSTLTTSTICATPAASNFGNTPTTTTTTTTNKSKSNNKTNHNVNGKGIAQISKRGSNVNGTSQGLDFSPTSVLQVQGCNGLFIYRTMDHEAGRCRRTDGKKWRCSRDVVPEQKYCPQHMHRGAKKHAAVSKPGARLHTARLAHTKTPNKANYATPNTNLSISIPGNSQLVEDDEKSTNSCSSDTTISDTTISAYEISLS